LVGSLLREAMMAPTEGNPRPELESKHVARPLPPEKRAEIEDLEQAIRMSIDAEISELAENLATTDVAHLFGDNEFKVHALAHKVTAKALERHLSEKLGWWGFLDRSILKFLEICGRIAAEPQAPGLYLLTASRAGSPPAPVVQLGRRRILAPTSPRSRVANAAGTRTDPRTAVPGEATVRPPLRRS
jgi:hypothetical protein